MEVASRHATETVDDRTDALKNLSNAAPHTTTNGNHSAENDTVNHTGKVIESVRDAHNDNQRPSKALPKMLSPLTIKGIRLGPSHEGHNAKGSVLGAEY